MIKAQWASMFPYRTRHICRFGYTAFRVPPQQASGRVISLPTCYSILCMLRDLLPAAELSDSLPLTHLLDDPMIEMLQHSESR